MIRMGFLILWATVTFMTIVNAVSVYMFGETARLKHLFGRILLAFVWPLALFSKQGRDFLFAERKDN